jgi:hypothetical protein
LFGYCFVVVANDDTKDGVGYWILMGTKRLHMVVEEKHVDYGIKHLSMVVKLSLAGNSNDKVGVPFHMSNVTKVKLATIPISLG